ncbi:MAG: Hsp20/alpha crystallin family protein [Thermodesulfobacteriota bacterium]|nr:Hsp20/alpha crystallin family protein [Thermodesulfobacteriota bacterium]
MLPRWPERGGWFLDPLSEMQRMQDKVNRIFSNVEETTSAGFPAVNVWNSEDGVMLTSEIPGIDVKDIDISLVGNTLTLHGSRTKKELKQGETYHRRERNSGGFARRIELPYAVDADNVEARYEKGILSIKLPRPDADKPRKISVKTV